MNREAILEALEECAEEAEKIAKIESESDEYFADRLYHTGLANGFRRSIWILEHMLPEE